MNKSDGSTLVMLVIPPGTPGTTPNREGAAGMGAVSPAEGGFRYAPQTVATVGQELIDCGLAISALDAPALGLDLDATLARIRAIAPDLVVAQVSWATRDADRAFLRAMGDTPSVAIGASARFMRDELSKATWVLDGDPIGRTAPVVEMILAGGDPPHWLDKPPTVADPVLPAWHLLPIEHYSHLSMSTSQGCDAGCLWCPYVVAQGQTYLAREPKDVVAELEAIVARYHTKRVVFRDPVFARDTDRAKAICRQILRSTVLNHGRAVSWECESRPEHFDGELVRLLSLAGCIGCKVGLESIDPVFLTEQRRLDDRDSASAYLSDVANLAHACRTWGVALRLYTMVGLPGQTVESCKSTALYAQALGPSSLTVKPFVRYPGLRGEYGPAVSEDLLEKQMSPLLAAAEAIRAQSVGQPARLRRAAWRLAYRVADAFTSGD